MAKYNTFVVMDCKKRTPLLVTSSARKAKAELWKGRRLDVWSENIKTATVYARHPEALTPYIQAEREYIAIKQMAAEVRNAARGIMRF